MSEPIRDIATQAGDDVIAELADQFLQRWRAGECPSVDEYTIKHPELAERIREIFPAMMAIEQTAGATFDVLPTTERVGATIGRYKLLEQIGEGGFGVVYMAEQQQPVRRKVALKIIKPGMDTRQVIARFEAERQALSMMDHPNIAKVLDAGTTDSGRPYFVMELVKGQPITQYCDEKHLTPLKRLELLLPVCQSIQHAHQKGIIHRDIKPTNILVAEYDQQPVPKVIDFGVAKATGSPLSDKTMFTGFGQIVGTLEYMSPEQAKINQLDIDTRSDIYSLGVLMYELLTGSTPFDKVRLRSAALDEMLRIIREEEPPKPSTKLSSSETLPSIAANRSMEPARLSRTVRGELDWIVMKALEKDRSRRYETANGFAMDVQRYLADEPVEACPPSPGYRFRKFARRNKMALAVAALVLFFLVLLGSGVGWTLRDRSERQAKVTGRVELILTEIDQLEEQQKWPEALAAARGAEAALIGGDAGAATAQQVHESLKGLEFIDRLDQIRMLRATNVEGAFSIADVDRFTSAFSFAHVDREYAQAFHDYGVDVDELTVEASIKHLKVRPQLAIPLAAALDHWAFVRRLVPERDSAGWKRLVAVARGIDPEPMRDRLRSTLERPDSETRDELRRLAESIDTRAHRPETLIALANTLRQVELPDYALRILRDAQYVYPSDYWLNFDLAHQLGEQRDHEGAVRFLTAAVSLRPNSAGAQYGLGFELRIHEKLDEAIAAYRKALELDTRHYAAHVNLASCLNAQRKVDEAIAVYRKLIEIYPDSYHAREFFGNLLRDQGKLNDANAVHGKAVELARKAIEHEPKSGARPYLTIARIQNAQGKQQETVDSYRKAVEADPKATDAHWQLAEALRGLGQPDEAIDAYRKGIEADPISAGGARNNLANLLRQRGKLDEAIDVYRKAIEIHANDASAYNGLGLVLKAQKKLDKAIDAFRTAIDLDPKNAGGSYINLGNVLYQQAKPDEAIAAYRTAIAIDPKVINANVVATAYANLGEVLYEQKRLNEAIAAYSTAIEIDPKLVPSVNTNINKMRKDKDFAVLRDREDFKSLVAAVDAKRPLNERAWELATSPDPARRDPTLAVARAEKAVAEAPYKADYWNTLGVARYRAGDFAGAIAALQKFRELRTADAEWSNPFFLAMAHWQLGNKDEARRWYEMAVVWMDTKAPTSESLKHFRREAAELLGVPATSTLPRLRK